IFFSSRRRHTRFSRDWSSDVCSSDLNREISLEKQTEIHLFGEELMKELSKNILEFYFQLGIRASHTDEPIHQVFCDYFTVTQHRSEERRVGKECRYQGAREN